MQIISRTIIFLIVLFLYIHIYFHLKTSDDLELFQFSELPSKDKLEEICDLRQPTVFAFHNERLLTDCTQENLANTYGAFDIKIKDKTKVTNDTVNSIPLIFKTSLQLLQNDNESRFISEDNSDFLDETTVVKTYQYNDELLRPYMIAECEYDYICGSHNSYTPLRYNLNYRNYYYVTEGSLTIKLTPPKSGKYLYKINDYDNFEFSSPVDPWSPQPKYMADYDKIKFLEISLEKGQILFIPAYWWYSIKFTDKAPTSICVFKYKTFMNVISISPHIFKKILQQQNTRHDSIKKYSTGASNNLNIHTGKPDGVNTITSDTTGTGAGTGTLNNITASSPSNSLNINANSQYDYDNDNNNDNNNDNVSLNKVESDINTNKQPIPANDSNIVPSSDPGSLNTVFEINGSETINNEPTQHNNLVYSPVIN